MRVKTLLITTAALAVTTGAQAQVWDAPSFMPPRPGEDIGIYISEPDGADLVVQGIWRQHGNLNLGVRVGFADQGADGAFQAAAETWGEIMSVGPDFPVDVSWTLGAGATFGDVTLLSVPLGLSIGRTLRTPLPIQVYGHPRLALIVASVNNNTATDLDGLFDLGADLHLTSDWKARLGVTLGGVDAYGLGVAYRFGRGVTVR
ncbi:MAG TPA: hypothetical protein VMM83_04965 [Longimicrobiales bacterium]|nr:hypothetical protein [Longimicrobiales bacterium]